MVGRPSLTAGAYHMPGHVLNRTHWTDDQPRSRNDNDMYDHMNNSVYNFLYVTHPSLSFPSSARQG